MNDEIPISNEAFQILKEIIENKGNSSYWKSRFEGLTSKEETVIRESFNELIKAELIDAKFYDNCPVIFEVKKDGYFYYENYDADTGKRYSVFAGGGSEKMKEYSKYDVFVSHANKDKLDFVDDLYRSLYKLGINIFYDKKSIEWGDNWKQRILSGTDEAEFAIIVISNNFFGREWTEKELTAFLDRQNESGQKLILPILHGIDIQDLHKQYPFVADIQAINSKEYTNCDEIALLFAKQLIKRLKTI